MRGNSKGTMFLLGIFAALGMLVFSQPALAYTYAVDGSVGDWGIDLSKAIKGATGQAIYPSTVFTHDGYLDVNKPVSPTANVVTEDNADNSSKTNTYVGPGYTHGSNLYDAEALYFDSDGTRGYIALITGTGPSAQYVPGDIAINVTSATAALYDSNPSVVYRKQIPYEYGIQMNLGTTNPELQAVTEWWSAYYDGSPTPNYAQYSDPWAIKTGSDVLGGGLQFAYAQNANGHWVYEASFLLSALGLGTGSELDIHWTMRCGNDVLDLHADVNPVPEPATMLLLGTGLVGLAGFMRKMRQKK